MIPLACVALASCPPCPAPLETPTTLLNGKPSRQPRGHAIAAAHGTSAQPAHGYEYGEGEEKRGRGADARTPRRTHTCSQSTEDEEALTEGGGGGGGGDTARVRELTAQNAALQEMVGAMRQDMQAVALARHSTHEDKRQTQHAFVLPLPLHW